MSSFTAVVSLIENKTMESTVKLSLEIFPRSIETSLYSYPLQQSFDTKSNGYCYSFSKNKKEKQKFIPVFFKVHVIFSY